MTPNSFRIAAVAAIVLYSAAVAMAAPVTWTINSTASSYTLAIPDQVAVYKSLTTAFQTRNQTGSAAIPWNTNTMKISGTVDTDYNEVGQTVKFLAGQVGIEGLNSGSYRPNPAAWNAGNSSYANNSAAPADIGGLLQFLPPVIGTFPMAFSFDGTTFDIASGNLAFVMNGPVNLSGTNFNVSTSSSFQGNPNTGVLFDVPSHVNQPLSFGGANNSPLGTISAAGVQRHLVIPFQQNFDISLGGAVLHASSTGNLVMDYMVPEPSTVLLAGIGLVSLATLARRARPRRRTRQ